MRTGASQRKSDLGLLVLLGVLWGMPYALTKIGLATIPPITLVAARIVLAAAMLWIVVWMVGRERPLKVAHIPQLFIQGCVGCLIPHLLIAFGQQSVDSALTSILNSMTPLFVCFAAWAGYERLTAGRWTGAILGLVGVLMVVGVGGLSTIGHNLLGQLAIVLATLSSAVSVIIGRKLNDVAPEVAAAGMLTSAAVVLVPFSFLFESPLAVTPSSASLAALLTNAFVTTALGFVIYFRLIRTIGSTRTASVGYLKPAVGVLIGCALMGEALTWSIAIGLVIIVVGVAAINQPDAGWISRRLPARSLLRLQSPNMAKSRPS